MDDEENVVIEEDYYAFLNVPRDASPEEINNAYRRLSRIYHPDKHLDPAAKKDAEILFNKTKRAYEVLNDPHQRAIYDNVGIKGLETGGWEIIQRTKTPSEICAEFERLAREREEKLLQQRTNPRGNVTVRINATDIFNSYNDEYGVDEESGFPNIEVSGMSLSQSIDAPITLRDTVTLGGQLSTHNGTGSGDVSFSSRRLLSNSSWVQGGLSIGNGPTINIRTFRALTPRIFGSGGIDFHFNNDGIQSGIDSTLAMQLDRRTMGYLTWRAGQSSSMSTSVIRDSETYHTGFLVTFGIPHSFISFHYTYKFKDNQLRLKGAVKAGTFGAMFEYTAQKKISEHNTLSAAVSLGVPTGVTLKIKLQRANQSYSFPIHLCEEIVPSAVFYATTVPLVGYFLLKKLVFDPISKEEQDRKIERQKEANKNRMAEKQREAKIAINLMSATFARIKSEEENRRGLVIVKALYGCKVKETLDENRDDVIHSEFIIDVTIPLQCLVKDSKLVLHESSKSQLPGFYDVSVGEEKELFIQYLYNTIVHETLIKDEEVLRIPKHSHRLNPI